MESMFRNADELITLDISNFDTSKVTDMSYSFSGCSSLKNLYYLSNLNSPSVINREGIFEGCYELFGNDSDYQAGYNGTNSTEDISIVLLGFNMYNLNNSRITFNIYFFSFENFEFPQIFNFTAIITYNSILRVLDNENNQKNVKCEKQEVENENKLKYKCAIDTNNTNIKNILLNNDINFEGNNINLIISPLASEYMNNLQDVPTAYDTLFDGANIFLMQKSKTNQDGKLFNISGIMEEDPHFEINKNITLNAKSDSEKKEINCRIIDITLQSYTLNCRLDNNIKYDLNNSLSVINDDILLITFEDKSNIIDNTNTNQLYHSIYRKKKSGLNAGSIIAIILVTVIALASVIAIIIFLKRKNNNKIVSDVSASKIDLKIK